LFPAVKGEVQFFPQTNIGGDGCLAQLLQRVQTERRKHLASLGVCGTEMAMDKRVGRAQKVRCGHGVCLVLRICVVGRECCVMDWLTHSCSTEYHAHSLFSKG